MASVEEQMAAQGAFAGRSAAEYQRAVRHSGRVAALKVLFPALALCIVVVFVAISLLARALPENVSIEGASITDGKIVMENPSMTGQTNDNRDYSLTAVRATQDLLTPEVIVLESVTAALPVSDSETATINAESGIYDRGREFLTLDAPFSVESSSGMRADLQKAEFDIAKGELVSDAPVTIRSGETEIVAQSLSMRDNGKTIIFDRDVRMTIDPTSLRNQQEENN